MNRVFRVIWNDVLCLWQCVSELTSANGKPSSNPSSSHHSTPKRTERFQYKALLSALVFALAGLPMANAQAAATPYQGSYTETITTAVSKTGEGAVRFGDPKFSNEGPIHVLITSTGELTISNLNFQVTAYVQGTSQSPSDPTSVAISGSNVDIDGGKLTLRGRLPDGRTSWLEVGRTNFGFMNVYNGATVTTPYNVGIGAWRSTTSELAYLTIDGKGTTFTAGEEFVVGDTGNGQNGAGVLTISGGAQLTVGKINTGSSQSLAKIYFNNAKLKVTQASTLFANINTVSGSELDVLDIQGELELDTSATGTYTQAANAAISGTGSITKKGVGNLILVANNTYSGGTHITEGSVQLGNGGTTGSAGTGDITVDSETTLALNRSDNLTLANLIKGGGTLRKLGDNTVDFANRVTVSKTQIDDGTLEVTGDFQGGDVVVGDAVEDPATAKFAIKAGETVSVKSLLIQSDGQLSTLGVPSFPSTLTVEDGLVVDGGQWNLTAGSSVSASTTEIKDGVVELPADVTLTSPTVKVGDGTGATSTAKLTVNGSLVSDNVTINSDGNVDFEHDTRIRNALTLEGGQAKVGAGKTVSMTETRINEGTIDVDATGTLSGRTLTVGDGDTAAAQLNNAGTVSFLTLNVNSDGTFDNQATTSATTLNTLNVAGGNVNVTSGSFAANTNNINAGTVTVASGSTYSASTLNVGNGEGDPESAKFINDGTLTGLSALTVKSDGSFKTSTNTSISSSITLDGGKAELSGGTTTVPTVTLNAGDFTVGEEATLTANTSITVGNGSDAPATLTQQGTVTTKNLTVNSDGVYTNAGALTVNETLQINGGAITLETGSTTQATTTFVADGEVTLPDGAALTTDTLIVGDTIGDPGSAKFTNNGDLSATTLTVNRDGEFTNDQDITLADIDLDGGAVNLTAGTTQVTGETNISDGTLNVAEGSTLDTPTLKVGDGVGDPATAIVNNAGTVTATDVTVQSDGKFTNSNTLTTTHLTVDQGQMEFASGSQTTASDTTIKAGSTTLSEGATLTTPTLNVGDGEGEPNSAQFTNSGTLVSDTVNVKKDGQFTNTVDLSLSNALVVDGGNVALTGGKTETPNTTINEGVLTVGADAQLDGGAITVGDGDTEDAWLKADGSVKGSTIDVASDGHFDIGAGGTATSTGTTTLNGGEITVAQGGTLNVGEENTDPATVGTENLVVNRGTVNANGDVNARNIVSDPALDGAEDDAKVIVGTTGHITLTPTNGDTLLENFDTTKGDQFQLDGRLTVNTQPDVTTTQADQADITGSGTLEKTGEGALTLTADNTFKTVEADDGTLTVAPESTLTTQTLTVGNADDVDSIVNLQGTTQAQDLTIETDGTLNVGNATSGDPVAVAVTNPISMDGGNLNVLAGGSLNTPNIVTPDLADEKASSVHVEQGGELHLSPTDGSKLFDGFNTNGGKDSIVIDGLLDLTVPAGSTVNQDPQSPIDGSGTFEKNGDGLFNVAANNPFAGNVELNGGETHIMEGGKLGNADVNVHAPATLSVDKEGTSLKSLTLDPGSTLKVVATPEGYSKLDVAEAVNLGGTLFTDIAGSREEDLKNGSFENVIHSENGTISGQFEKFDDNSELFNFVPYITADKKSVGLTPLAATGDHNLVSIAERLGASRALDAARTLDAVFNQSPDQALSRMFYSISDPEMALQALLQSLPTVSGASSQMVADSSQHLAALTDLRPDCSQTAMGRHVWAKTYGAWARQNGYLGASGYRDDAFGVAAGADVCFNASRVGFMVGYGNDFVRSRDFSAQQTVRADTLQAGVYGSTPVNDTFDVDFKAGVGYSFVNTKRDIPFAQREAKADFHNTLAYAGVGLNALVLKTDALEVRPFVRLDYFVTHNRSYHETGADELNLHAKSGNYQTLVTQTGVKLHLKVANQVEANALVAVGYNLLGDKASTTAAFEGNPGQTFTTEGAQHGRVSGQFGLDLGYQISPAARFAVGYDLWVRPGYVQHTPNVSFKYTF